MCSVCVRAGLEPTQDKLSSDTPKGKPFGQSHSDHIHSVRCERPRCVDALFHGVSGNKGFSIKQGVKPCCTSMPHFNGMRISSASLNPADEMCICGGDGSQHACSRGSSLLLDNVKYCDSRPSLTNGLRLLSAFHQMLLQPVSNERDSLLLRLVSLISMDL